jgi:hypothetical protein
MSVRIEAAIFTMFNLNLSIMKTMQFDKREMNQSIYYLLFKLWMRIHCHCRTIQKDKSRYYDSLGMIDTLGYDSERTNFTYSYSDEMCFLWGFNLRVIGIEFINN